MQPLEVSFDYPAVFTVMREHFDAWLVHQALKAGAVFKEGTCVQGVDFLNNEYILKTSRGIFRARYLVGADGAASIIRRSLPFDLNLGLAGTLEAELRPAGNWGQNHRNTIFLEYGIINHGYIWVFPKKIHLSVGLMSFRPAKKPFNDTLSAFLKTAGLIPQEIEYRRHAIPFLTRAVNSFHCTKALLVGDAAALTDPLTGEGIYYALKSAAIAAEVLEKAAGISADLNDYTRAVSEVLVKELQSARKIAGIVYPFSGLVHRLILKQPELARSLIEITHGRGSYNDLHGLMADLKIFPHHYLTNI